MLSVSARVQAHSHLQAGATSSNPGATLQYDPLATDYTTNASYVFSMSVGTTNDAYFGYYYTGDMAFSALAATGDNGGPEIGHAAPGTYIQVKLLSVEGPSGASFGFWETLGQGVSGEGINGTNLTWSVPVPFHNGTNLIHVSESDGSPEADPYGHLHGRIYSVTKPGLYIATWQFVDTSTNGSGGGPVDLPSAPFATYYQADFTMAAITPTTNGINLTFATPSNQPDDLSTPPWNYFLYSSPNIGSNATWQQLGSTIVGDDTLHTLTVTNTGSAMFFRLGTDGGN